MRTDDSSVSMIQVVLVALGRGACIVFGGTLVGHRLASSIADDAGSGDGLAGYWPWLGDALNPTGAVTEAIGNTMILAAAGILIGAVIGGLFGALLRVPGLRRVIDLLAIPTMAVAIPGLMLYPLAVAVSELDLAPLQAPSLGQSLDDGLRALGLWGSLVGLAVAPAIAMLVAGAANLRTPGAGVAGAWAGARPEAGRRWRWGVPTTALLFGLTGAELLSDYPGMFHLFFDRLTGARPDTALTLLFWVLLAGAGLALVIDVVGAAVTGGRSRPAPLPLRPDGPGVVAVIPAVVVIGLAVAGAVLASPLEVDRAEPLSSPTVGGPWLGTDQLGRSNLTVTLAGIAPALLSALLPALAATALGWLWARLMRTAGGLGDRLAGAVVDALWWPLPMMAGLAFLAAGEPTRPEFDPLVIAVIGLALTPMAARLAGRMVVSAPDRVPARLAAIWLFLSAIGLSVHLLIGFAGLADAERANLGLAIADALADYDRSPWPLLVPALAAAAVLATLYALAASLVSPADPAPAGIGFGRETEDHLGARNRGSNLADQRRIIPAEDPMPEPQPVALAGPTPDSDPDSDPGRARIIPGPVPVSMAEAAAATEGRPDAEESTADRQPVLELEPGHEPHPETELEPGHEPHPGTELEPGHEPHPETEFEPGHELHPETELEPGHELHPETEFEPGHELHPVLGAAPDTGLHPETEPQPDTEPVEREPGRVTDLDRVPDTDPGPDTGRDTDPGPDTERDTDPGPDTDRDTDPDGDTDRDTEPGLDTDRDTDPDGGTDRDSDPNTDLAPDTEPTEWEPVLDAANDPEPATVVSRPVGEAGASAVEPEDLELVDPELDSRLIEEATRTVELRPSTLRRAGIAAPTMPKSPTELSSGWSKPTLARRPGPPDTGDSEREPDAGDEDRSTAG